MTAQVADLLRRQAVIELQASAQMALLSALVEDENLRDRFHVFAGEELDHFRDVCAVATSLGTEVDLSRIELNLVADPTEALVLLLALEDTIRHYLNDLSAVLGEPHRSKIKRQEEQETVHQEELDRLHAARLDALGRKPGKDAP